MMIYPKGCIIVDPGDVCIAFVSMSGIMSACGHNGIMQSCATCINNHGLALTSFYPSTATDPIHRQTWPARALARVALGEQLLDWSKLKISSGGELNTCAVHSWIKHAQ